MKCPRCSDPSSQVLETRRLDACIWRRRYCEACTFSFVSVESATHLAAMPKGIHKVARGIRRVREPA